MTVRISRWMLVLLAFVALGAGTAGAQAGTISGRVTAAESGTPLADARVQALAPDGSAVASGYSDEQGRFRLANVGPGTYTVHVARLGYGEQRFAGVNVTAGSTTEVAVALSSVSVRLNPVVVSVGRHEQRALEAPASISVVDTREVEERPALAPTDHLRGMPGVDVVSTGLLQSNVVARGFNNVFSGALLMLTDYRYASVPSLRVNASYLIPVTNEDIGRMEVLLGPGAALYGPNSANGVLHIISRSPFDSPGTTFSVTGGERSVIRGALRHASVVGDQFAFKVSGQYMSGTDWPHVDPFEREARQEAIDAGANPATLRIGRRDPKVERWTGDVRMDFRPTAGTEIVASGGRAVAGKAVELTALGAAQANDWEYDYYQLRGRSGRLFAQAAINLSDAGDTYLLRTGQSIVDRSRLMLAQVQHGADLGARQSFIYGIDLQRTEPRTEGTITGRNEDDDTIDEIGAYIHSETRLSPRFDFVAALRVDDHNRLDDPVWSPRAAIVFKPAPDQSFRLTYNRAFATPTSNNLFLDIIAASSLGGLPFGVRAAGVPAGGFTFRRDCAGGVGGLCMRSPFPAFGPMAPAQEYLPADATRYWPIVAQILYAQSGGQIDIRNVPQPTAAQVGTVLRTLNVTTETFDPASPSDVRDVDPMRPTISNVLELGYKGLLGGRLLLAADVYYERKNDFVGPLIVETPNAFLDPASTAAYLASRGYPAAAAAQIAAAATMIPVGTVTPNSALTSDANLLLTYRNFGELELWGSDIAAEAILTDRVSATLTYSFVSDDFFPRSKVGGLSDVALNAPQHKGSVGVRYRDEPRGLMLGARGRHVASFPMNSGVYIGTVPAYTLFDASFAYRLPFASEMVMSLDALNLLNERHQEFIGAPQIGRLVLAKVQYTF